MKADFGGGGERDNLPPLYWAMLLAIWAALHEFFSQHAHVGLPQPKGNTMHLAPMNKVIEVLSIFNCRNKPR